MTGVEWTIRRADPGDTERIMRLVRAVHGDRYPEINARYWQWRYDNNAGFDGTVFLAEHGGEVIGLRPVAIFDYVWGAARLKGAMYTGVMTHPDHRRRGVFRSLVNAANEFVVEHGAAFCMTLPNEASLPGFRNSPDWRYPGVIPVYIKPIDTRRVLATQIGATLAAIAKPGVDTLFRKATALECDDAIQVEPVAQLPEAFDEIARQFAREAGTLMLERSAEFCNWRYAAHPHNSYRMQIAKKNDLCIGAVVTAMGEQSGLPVGMIVDTVAQDCEGTIRRLIHSAEATLSEQNVAMITCQATTPLLCRALQAEGFRKLPNRLSPKRFHFVYRLTGAPGLPNEPKLLQDWHLMFGDSDNA